MPSPSTGQQQPCIIAAPATAAICRRPTAETLQAMMKVCKQQAEQAKVTVRHGRQQALQEVKRIASEDQRKRVEREVQKLTDEIVASIDRLVQEKERSIREHSS